MKKRADPELQRRGALVRSISALREMLPGSLVERERKCGKSNCRCAEGKQLHLQHLLTVQWMGKIKTFHISAGMVEDVRSKVKLYKRFRQIGTTIGEINLRRFVRRKQGKEKP